MQENVNFIVVMTHFRSKPNAHMISNKNYQEFFNEQITKTFASDWNTQPCYHKDQASQIPGWALNFCVRYNY